jgi:hypothetical protein
MHKYFMLSALPPFDRQSSAIKKALIQAFWRFSLLSPSDKLLGKWFSLVKAGDRAT